MAELDIKQLNALGIGETLTQRIRVVSVQAGDDDYNGGGTIVLPTGLEILSAEPRIVSSDEGKFSISSIEQPGYIGIDQNMAAEMRQTIQNISEDNKDASSSSALKVIANSVALTTVIDGSTHGRIKWTAHAEGHKWKGDGHIKADIEMTLLRGPKNEDILKIMLLLAKMTLETSKEQVLKLIEAMEEIAGYENIKKSKET